MGFNDPEAAKLGPKVRGITGASMPSRRAGDPRQYRSAAPLLSERMLGEGLRMDQDGRIAIDFSLVERTLPNYIHTAEVVFNASADVAAVDDNQPATERFLFNSSRHVRYIDLSLYRQVQFEARRGNAASAAGSPFVELRYFTAGSATVGDYLQSGSEPVRLTITSTQVTLLTEWIDLVPEARSKVYLAVVADDGDGSASPNYGYVGARFRR